MTAAPARAISDLCSTRTFPGAAPFALEPAAASNLARLRAAETRAYATRLIPGSSLALAKSPRRRSRRDNHRMDLIESPT
jgi:hypothetical protein